MQAVIVYNALLMQERAFEAQINAWVSGFARAAVRLIPVPNIIAIDYIKKNRKYFSFCLFFDKDTFIADAVENIGIPVFNTAWTIRVCDDRALLYSQLKEKKVTVLKTVVLPFLDGKNLLSYYGLVVDILTNEHMTYPFFLKERFSYQNRKAYLCCNPEDLKKTLKKIGEKQLIAQKINFNQGIRSYRYVVVNDRVVCVVESSANKKLPPVDDLSGKAMRKLAIKAAKSVYADFAAVDIVIDAHNVFCVFDIHTDIKTVLFEAATDVNLTYRVARYVRKEAKFRRGEQKYFAKMDALNLEVKNMMHAKNYKM